MHAKSSIEKFAGRRHARCIHDRWIIWSFALAVTVVAVYEVGERLAISNIELIIDDERRPINDLIESMCNCGPAPVESAHHQTLVQQLSLRKVIFIAPVLVRADRQMA